MAYRLDRQESVIEGLKRVIGEEIKSAGGRLSGAKNADRDEAIHEARKSIKKVRALLRLANMENAGALRRENERLRDIARRLSEFRDAFAVIETFDDLRKKYPDETRGKLRSVRAGLVRKRNQAGKDEDVGIVLDRAAAALGKVAGRVLTWPLEENGFSAIGQGLENTYRAGRAALVRGRRNSRPEILHQLRKRVKDHWYHMRLLESLWSGVMKAYEKSLKDLETRLGNTHNLFVLQERIMVEPAFYGRPKDIELILKLIEKYQKALRDQSLSLAERVYEQKPRHFRRGMKRLWDTWRHESKTLEDTGGVA